MSRLALAVVLVAACGHGDRAAADPDPTPQVQVAAVPPAELCVTKGALAGGGSGAPLARVDVPTFRAVAPAHAGDAAAIRVVVRGQTENTRALASGQLRRQLGLKLRAANGCNLVYVMWRLDPKPKLDVSVKENPGARNAKECGADGYTKIRPARSHALPALDDGAPHELAAEIDGDRLVAWVDGHVAWQGTLPASARKLAGPAGVRSDNLAFDLVGFSADRRAGAPEHLRCHADEGD